MPQKRAYGAWMLAAFGMLARLKGLRGTRFDLFGRSAERRMERRLIADYVRAAGLANEAGFDMLEVHFAHGYLLASFISPLTIEAQVRER